MCGIAGAFDLVGERIFSESRLRTMAQAIAHRGPDDEHMHIEAGVAMAARRLAIIDVAHGRQPIGNETGDIWVTFEGELYEYPELRVDLAKRGHKFATHCDTEAWVHLYEELGERVFHRARGQFSTALWDRNERKLLLGRDRAGIGPLYYAQKEGWLLWASEVKGLLASGMIDAAPDVCGIDYFFNFYSMPTERTCFKNISMLPPGHYARVQDGALSLHQYWDLDFPDRGDEKQFATTDLAAEELERRLRGAVRRRLVGEVPIGCYISGGLDSTVILALVSEERGAPLPSFTIGLENAGPDERDKATESAAMIGSPVTIINMTETDIASAFPRLIRASEGPVVDTSAACMVPLADANRRAGNKIAVTGEGADELLAGYVWFKWSRGKIHLNNSGASIERLLSHFALPWIIGGGAAHRPPFRAFHGIRLAQEFSWMMMAQSRERLYSSEMWERLDSYSAYDELPLSAERMRRWHPLNRSLYAAFKVMMPGLLLHAKGDRALRQASTEGRFPFLDEDVVDFCSQIGPQYKLRGWTDKWLLRKVAERVLPAKIARRRKTMFRANYGKMFLREKRPAWVDQLLSPESLRATGYFDPQGVQYAREAQARYRRRSLRRFTMDLGLAGVVSTQLWHHLFLGGGLADLPEWSAPQSLPRAHSAERFAQPQS